MSSPGSLPPPLPASVIQSGLARVRLFVDFWNLQLTLNEREAASSNASGFFLIDWLRLPPTIIAEVSRILGTQCSYEGTTVYTSFDSASEAGVKHKKWATNWLDRQIGMQVNCYERQRKHPPKCNHCHQPIQTCPLCSQPIAGTVEKGVDTAIVTDMIRLAWEQSYNVAVVVSSDQDLVPAVEFLDARGFKIIQAGFPPLGAHLSKASWASMDLFALRNQFRRGN